MRQILQISLGVLSCLLLLGPTMAFGQSAQGTATASVGGAAGTVLNQMNLAFGTFDNTGIISPATGTVDIDAATGGTSSTGAVVIIAPGGNGSMLVTGPSNTNFSANFSDSPILLACLTGGCVNNSMAAILTLSAPAQTDASGAATVNIGGSLDVRSQNTVQPGAYIGFYELNVSF